MHDSKQDPKQAITILLVDDDPHVLKAAKCVLQASNRPVLTAENAERALQLAAEYPGQIDVLVSDLRMPGMNGVELANVLCKGIPGLCVLLMSGDLNEFDLSEAPAHAAIMEKPFTPNQLNALVNRLVERSRKTRF